jgi:homoserine acetyltransferase
MKRNNTLVPQHQGPDEEYVVVPQLPAAEKEYETYNLGDFKLKSCGVIPDAHIAYKTFGNPQSPAIIYLTWFSGGERRVQFLSPRRGS